MKANARKLQPASFNFLFFGGISAVFNLCVFQYMQNLFQAPLLVGSIIASLIGILFFVAGYSFLVMPFRDFCRIVKSRLSVYLGLPALILILETVWMYLAVRLMHMHPAMAKTLALLVALTMAYIVTELLRDRREAEFPCRDTARRLLKSNTYVLLAGGVAAFIMIFVYFCYDIIPFGDNTILRMDLYHQYGPLFGELYDRTVHGMSFIYSWESGLGSSFLGNFFNYLSSPMNILIFLFRRENVIEAISLLILLKAAFTAGTFTYYIKKSFGRQDFYTASFGLAYAFCAYFLAYYWNVMWIDAMMLFPLILLGVEQIIHKNKITLYVVTLSLAMFSNYYMSYTICLFVVLYFIAYYFGHYSIHAKTAKGLAYDGKVTIVTRLRHSKFLQSGFSFAGASLLCAALVAFALIPTFFTLQATSATSGTFPETYETYFNFFDFLANHLPGLETTIRSSGEPVLPNVYCGLAVLILVPLYMLCKSIRIREKAVNIGLLAVLAFSFQTNFLNYIWHGFHFPNDLPYRFSFMYSFLLLVMAYQVFLHIKDISFKDVMGVGMVVALFIVLVDKSPHKFVEQQTVPLSLFFVAVYTLLLVLMKRKTFKPVFLAVLLFASFASEIILSSTNSYIINQSKTSFASDYKSYRDVLDHLKREDSGFYRTELCQLRARMDPCWYGYNGVSTFSSMAYESTSGLQYNLGMFGNRINSYTYNPQTPVYNAMFGIKYLIRNNELSQALSTDYYTEKYLQTDDGLTAYENKYSLPVGFAAKKDLKNWNSEESDPFQIQQELFKAATGVGGVFVPITYDSYYTSNVMDITDALENGTFSYQKIDSTSDGSVTIEFTATNNTNIYLYVTSYSAKKLEVEYDDGNTLSQDIGEPYILDLGKRRAGEKISVTIDVGDDSSGTISSYVYTINKQAFEQGYRYLKEGGFQLSKANDTSLSGKVTALEDGVFYTSIPYDAGWTVKVDGKKVETYAVSESLLAVDITKGTHSIELHYTPKGLLLGIGLSGAAWLGVLAYTAIRAGKKKRAVPAPLLTEDTPPEQ